MKAFQSTWAKLEDAVNPCDISGRLFAERVISNTERQEIDDPYSPVNKKIKALLTAVRRAIHSDATVFYKFMKVLEQEKKYKGLVNSLKSSVKGTMVLSLHMTFLFHHY